jgi:hypothetical protein
MSTACIRLSLGVIHQGTSAVPALSISPLPDLRCIQPVISRSSSHARNRYSNLDRWNAYGKRVGGPSRSSQLGFIRVPLHAVMRQSRFRRSDTKQDFSRLLPPVLSARGTRSLRHQRAIRAHQIDTPFKLSADCQPLSTAHLTRFLAALNLVGKLLMA